jgi:putative ABC transport system permease protein
MLFRDIFHTGLRSIRHARMRSFLTILGIVIGISSVIVLMSVGTSAQALIVNEVNSIGSNLIFIIPGATLSSRASAPASAFGVVTKTLVQADVNTLEREPSIQAVAPAVYGQGTIAYGNNNAIISYQGVTANFFQMRNFKVASGRPFNIADVQGGNRVVVLGEKIAQTLFGNFTPIGKYVRLANTPLQVVGVLGPQGVGPGGVDQDNIALVPLTVAQNQLIGINYFNFVTVQANPAYNMDFVKSRVVSDLRQDHSIIDPTKDDFTVETQQDALAILGNITSIMTVFLAAIASISLVVGGIGIMNIMLVSVVERTREIGLRKAVGATNKDILRQFLLESILLTFVGGLIGIALGAFIDFLAYIVLRTVLATGWVFALPLSSVLLGAGVSMAIGIVFGFYPARQAARKSPIEALHYE